MEKLLRKLQEDYPDLRFIPGVTPCWSPHDNHILYAQEGEHGMAGLLHELAHARLGHTSYSSDLELLNKEVAAWHEALQLAAHYGIPLDENHAEDCVDTYRDWVHKRSTCPVCQTIGVEARTACYSCLNCGHEWKVSSARFCRPYRRSKAPKGIKNRRLYA